MPVALRNFFKGIGSSDSSTSCFFEDFLPTDESFKGGAGEVIICGESVFLLKSIFVGVKLAIFRALGAVVLFILIGDNFSIKDSSKSSSLCWFVDELAPELLIAIGDRNDSSFNFLLFGCNCFGEPVSSVWDLGVLCCFFDSVIGDGVGVRFGFTFPKLACLLR